MDLKADEIRLIIDLCSVYQKFSSYKLSEEQVLEFSKPLTSESPLLLEILSDPSGEIDEESVEGELLEDFLNPPSIEDTDDSDDLSDLFN